MAYWEELSKKRLESTKGGNPESRKTKIGKSESPEDSSGLSDFSAFLTFKN